MPGQWLHRAVPARHRRCILCLTVPLAGLLAFPAAADTTWTDENIFLSDAAVARFQQYLERVRDTPACLAEIRGYLAGTQYDLTGKGDPPLVEPPAAVETPEAEPDAATSDDAPASRLEPMAKLTNCLTAHVGRLANVEAGAAAGDLDGSIVVTVIREGDTKGPSDPFDGSTKGGGSLYMCTGLWRGGALIPLAQSGIQDGCPDSTFEDIFSRFYTPPPAIDPGLPGFGAQPVDPVGVWGDLFTTPEMQIPPAYGPVDMEAALEHAVRENDTPGSSLLQDMDIKILKSWGATECSCPGAGK